VSDLLEGIFVDPISGRQCFLATDPLLGVAHPNCPELADVTVELDAFYCRACGWNGRVSGAWVMDVVRERSGTNGAEATTSS
jgi:hypothetical protein